MVLHVIYFYVIFFRLFTRNKNDYFRVARTINSRKEQTQEKYMKAGKKNLFEYA